MKRRSFLKHCMLTGGLALTGSSCALSKAKGTKNILSNEKPNIIYILADDLGYGDVGFQGQKKILTPSLDKMASEGLVFTQHYAGSTVCGPSRACLFTGMSQAVGYIKNNPSGSWQRENLRDEDVTIFEKLKEADYKTACFGKWGLGPQGKSGFPTRQGVDEFVGYDIHTAAHNYYPEKLCANDRKMELKQEKNNWTYSHNIFTKKALAYLKRKHEKPFFLYLPYTIPHGPFNPPSKEPYESKKWKDWYKKYAAMVTLMDTDIGRLFKVLKQQGLDKNTLVIFSSDNGPQSSYGKGVNDMTKFFNSSGPLRGIKRDMFEGGIRVPTIAWWPGKIKAGKTGHVSAFHDVMPTFCELVGVKAPDGIDGISFLPTLLGKNAAQKKHDFLYWEFVRGELGGRQGLLDVKRNIKAIRYGRFDRVRLYDLNKDLGEKNNIADTHPEIAKELGKKMDTMRGPSELWPISMHDKGWMPID